MTTPEVQEKRDAEVADLVAHVFKELGHYHIEARDEMIDAVVDRLQWERNL